MPKLFPKELEDATAVRVLPAFEGVFPAFEGVAQKLSSTAMNVVDAARVNLPVPTLEKKAKINVFSTPLRPLVPNVANITISDKPRSGSKDEKTKEPDHVSTTRFNPALLSKTRVPPSASMATKKINRIIQDAFNGRTQLAGGENVVKSGGEKVDVATTGGKKVDGVTSSSIVTETLSHMIQGAFNGRADTAGSKNTNAVTTNGEKTKAATVKLLVQEQEKSMEPSNLKRTGTVFSSVRAALPVAATSAVTLATGWLVGKQSKFYS